MKEESVIKMEFLLTLNENIVVQRFYNVRNYNPKARRSVQLSELMKDIEYTLVYDLKMKTVMYMLDNQDSILLDPDLMNTSNTDGPENFNMYVKISDETIFHRIFDGKMFPPKVRYTVDIRPSLKRYLSDLTAILSAEELETTYLNYQL